MNVILTRRCTNNCPYCFANPERSAIGHLDIVPDKIKGSISIENVNKLALWLANNQPKRINLIGGEPFLHSKLPEIIAIFREKCPDSSLTIFTGGIVPPKVLINLSPDDLNGILINVNEERDYPDHHVFSKVKNFIEEALVAGFRITLGFNVWRLDFDPEFMPRLAYSLGRQGFRWSLANPNLMGDNKVVAPYNFKQLSVRIVQMLKQCTDKGLRPNLDCPLPLCFFSSDDLAWIAQYHPNVVENLGSCSAPIDITPDLEVMRCFSLSALPHTSIDQHASIKDLIKWFVENQDLKLLSRNGIFEECSKCSHFFAGRCQGGCFGWRDIEQDGEIPEPHHLYNLLQQREYAQVVETLESTSRWFATPLMYYLGAIAAQKLNDRERFRRFTAIGLEYTSDQNLRDKLIKLLPLSAS